MTHHICAAATRCATRQVLLLLLLLLLKIEHASVALTTTTTDSARSSSSVRARARAGTTDSGVDQIGKTARRLSLPAAPAASCGDAWRR